MTLLKKTVVLASVNPCGYVAVIRVGNETGIKIAGEQFSKGMQAVIKIGNKAQILQINGKTTEADSTVQLEQNDEIGAVIVDDGQVICRGGKHLLDKEILAFFEDNSLEEEVSEIENERTTYEENKLEESKTHAELTANTTQDETMQTTIDNAVREETSEQSPDNTVQIIETAVQSEEDNLDERVLDSAEENINENEEEILKSDMLQRLSKKRSNYYNEISGQIDELFVVHPREKILENLIPDSDWIKVAYEKDDYYVIGRLYGDGKVIYLGYGVPGVENVTPPKATQGIANWIPIKGLDDYEGYWLFFQNADTGKIT